ncbi:unnamed protein product [Mytilus edulis]|uniref:MYND-type domain-containing protein n=1 Tax=Mytilus edulis TaxID=6550 RepID=A0A8S3R260_MYTED|nr:unnamed protein product [Mytilus edulis]
MATINYTHDDDIEEELKTQIIEICTASVQKPVIKVDLEENQKRWLLVGICMQSILSTTLRNYTEPLVLSVYNSMKIAHGIQMQIYPNQLKKYPKFRTRLNYEAINKNRTIARVHKKSDVASYDYKVGNHVEFSKLFMKTYMAHYTAFDDTCDLSALLSLIGSIDIFPQPVKNVANKIRLNVRNPWAHCNFDEWDTLLYQTSFQLMHQLIKCLSLSKPDETKVLADLTKWEQNGFLFLQGYAVDQIVVNELRQQTQVLAEYALKMKSGEDSTFIKIDEAMSKINGEMMSVCKRIDTIEISHNKQQQSITEMNKDVNIIYERTLSIENVQTEHRQDIDGAITNIKKIDRDVDNLKTESKSTINRVETLAGEVKSTTEDVSYIKNDIIEMKEDIGDFKNYMSRSKPVDKGSEHHTMVISGLGGCGKTTLATEFAWRSHEFYQGGVFWMSAESESSLEDSITTLAIDVNETGKDFRETLKKTLKWFSHLSERWLLVIDNADEEYLSDYTKEILFGSWKRNTQGHIIITTRREPNEIEESMGVKLENCIHLGIFETADGLEFVKRRTDKRDNQEDNAIVLLVEELGGLPLALEQAAAHIKSIKCSVEDYVKRFEKKRINLLKAAQSSMKISKDRLAVATTWQMNIEYISRQSEKEGLGTAAITVMEIASFLFADDIPKCIFNVGNPVVEDNDLTDALDDDVGCGQIIEILTRFSLFQIMKDMCLSVHRLVQEVIRDSLSQDRRQCILQHALRMVNKALTSCVTPNNILLDDYNGTKRGSLITWSRLAANTNTLKGHLLHFVKGDESRQNICFNDQMLKILQTTALYHSIHQRQALALADQEQMVTIIPTLKVDTKYFHELTSIKIPLLQKDREKILECLASVLHTDSEEIFETSAVVPYNSETLREMGNEAFKEQRYHDAIQCYTEGIRSCPTDKMDMRFFSNRSLAYIRLQDYEHALVDASRCIEIAPDNWKGYCWKAYSVSGLIEIGSRSSNMESVGLASACIASQKNKLCLLEHKMKMCYPILNYKMIERPESLCHEIMSLTDRPFTTLMLRQGRYEIREVLTTTKSILVIGVEEGVEINTGGSFNICRLPKDVLAVDIEPEKTIHAHFENIKFLKGGCQITVSKNSVATFYNCKFSNGQKGCEYFPKCKGDKGICVSDGGTAYVESCVLDRCGGGGILSCGNGTLTDIRNCTIRNMRQMGVEAKDGGAIRAINNTISNNQTHGFAIGPNGYGYISGNIIQGNGAEGVWSGGNFKQDESMEMNEEGASRAVLNDNIIRQNGLSGISFDGGYFEVKGNKIISNWLWGLMVKSRSYSYILDNDISENKCGGIRIGTNYTAAVFINGNTIRDHIGPSIYTVSSIENSLKTSRRRKTIEKQIKHIAVGDGEMNGESREPFIFSTNFLNDNERGIQHPQDIFCMIEACCFCRKISQHMKFCSRCKKAKYCSKECQTNHWIQHKHMCKLLNASYVVEVQMSDTEPNNLGSPIEHGKPYGAYQRTFDPKLVGLGKGTPPDRNSCTRFIVKIQSGREYGYYDPYKKLIVYDQTVTFDIQLSNPELYHLCNECGALTGHKVTAKKIFCWASFKNSGQTICFHTENLPPYQTW